MFTQALDTNADFAVALLVHYSFDLGGYSADELIDHWLKDYPDSWLRLAVIEALYQGRYKAISVEQILSFWQRRHQAIYHFNHEFARLICAKLPQKLLGEGDPTVNFYSPVLEETDQLSNAQRESVVGVAEAVGDRAAKSRGRQPELRTLPEGGNQNSELANTKDSGEQLVQKTVAATTRTNGHNLPSDWAPTQKERSKRLADKTHQALSPQAQLGVSQEGLAEKTLVQTDATTNNSSINQLGKGSVQPWDQASDDHNHYQKSLTPMAELANAGDFSALILSSQSNSCYAIEKFSPQKAQGSDLHTKLKALAQQRED